MRKLIVWIQRLKWKTSHNKTFHKRSVGFDILFIKFYPQILYWIILLHLFVNALTTNKQSNQHKVRKNIRNALFAYFQYF